MSQELQLAARKMWHVLIHKYQDKGAFQHLEILWMYVIWYAIQTEHIIGDSFHTPQGWSFHMPNALKKWPPHWPVIVPLAMSGTNQAFARHLSWCDHEGKNDQKRSLPLFVFQGAPELNPSAPNGHGWRVLAPLLVRPRSDTMWHGEFAVGNLLWRHLYVRTIWWRSFTAMHVDGDAWQYWIMFWKMLQIKHAHGGMHEHSLPHCPVSQTHLRCNTVLQLEQYFDPRTKKWKTGFHVQFTRLLKAQQFTQVTTDWTWNWKIAAFDSKCEIQWPQPDFVISCSISPHSTNGSAPSKRTSSCLPIMI